MYLETDDFYALAGFQLRQIRSSAFCLSKHFIIRLMQHYCHRYFENLSQSNSKSQMDVCDQSVIRDQ